MTHKNWWHTEGSGMRPLPNEDIEEFAKRITGIAWSNGEFVEREACLKITESMSLTNGKMNKPWRTGCRDVAEAIRARG